MSRDLFVTGMIRSGTSLVQVLLTNHPDMFVVYQPFHQLYVETKARFLAETGQPRLLPMGDGLDEPPGEAAAFLDWLAERRFSPAEADDLARQSVLGKGGSVPELSELLTGTPGTFHDLRAGLLAALAEHLGSPEAAVVGSKEVLCEEYVPALASRGSRVLVVVRDPRAVVSSANQGSYLAQVGDRYPVLMLVRLWRKSVRAALAARASGAGDYVRYEDVAGDPRGQLGRVAEALDLAPFPADLTERPLLDHCGRTWSGNSSFGAKAGVDTSSTTAWKDLLEPPVAELVEACTLPELRAVGYPTTMTTTDARRVIENFVEDEAGVRPSYLEMYRLTDERRAQEVERSELQTT